MVSVYEKNIAVPASSCGYEGKMGLSGLAAQFMDMATEHADLIGIGFGELKKDDLFWLAIRTRIDIVRHPEISEKVTFRTWTERPQKIVYDRDYEVVSGGETIARGRTQWGLYNFASGRLAVRGNVYPPELEAGPAVIAEPYRRFSDEPADEPLGTYTVKSTDIDLGGHMNNVAYIRAFESLFTVAQLKERDFRSLEIQYKKPCFEGDTIAFSFLETEKETVVRGTANGEAAVWLLLRK